MSPDLTLLYIPLTLDAISQRAVHNTSRKVRTVSLGGKRARTLAWDRSVLKGDAQILTDLSPPSRTGRVSCQPECGGSRNRQNRGSNSDELGVEHFGFRQRGSGSTRDRLLYEKKEVEFSENKARKVHIKILQVVRRFHASEEQPPDGLAIALLR